MVRLRYLLLLAVVGYLLTGLTQVGPDERGVVRRFGRVVDRPGPGLYVGLPWGLDRVDRVPVRAVRQVTVGYVPEAGSTEGTPPGQLLTGDQNLVNVQLVVDYQIGETDADLDAFVMHKDRVDAALSREAEAAAAEWVGGRPVDEVLLTGNAALPAWVMARLPDRLAPLGLGVVVQRVSAAYLAPPEEVRAAFEAVTQAQTNIRTRENQARREADQRLRQAAAQEYRQIEDAKVFRSGALAQARADADAFRAQLAAYRALRQSDPAALRVMWLAEMRKTLDGVTKRGGRVEPLDRHLGPDGLDVNQILNLRRR